jgi:hypothetical protein
MAHDKIDIRIIREKSAPVAVGSHEIRLLSIDLEYPLTGGDFSITSN